MQKAKSISVGIAVIILLALSVTIFLAYDNTGAAEETQESALDVDATNQIANKEKLAEQLRRAAIALEPGLANASSDWDKAVLLRNLVYSHTHVGADGSSLIPLTLGRFKDVMDGSSPQFCSGMAFIYIGLLQAFGLKARLLKLATKAAFLSTDSPDTHVSVEVYLNGKWIVQDPTFNVHWELNGVPLGIRELRKAFQQHEHPRLLTDGFPVISGRALADYYLPFAQLTAYVEMGTLDVIGTGKYSFVSAIPSDFNWRRDIVASPLGSNLYTGIKLNRDLSFHTDAAAGSPNDVVLPDGWQQLVGVTVERAPSQKGVIIETNQSPLGYQLKGGAFSLPAGAYRITIRGRVIDGGLGLGLLTTDGTSPKFLAQNQFMDEQWKSDKGREMFLDFSLEKPTTVRVILSNWRDNPRKSTWLLKHISIGELERSK